MLKRRYARISIVLVILGLAILLLFKTYYGNVYEIVFACIGVALSIAGIVISFIFIRCPSCRRRSVGPQWSKSGTRYCSFCGERFVYDDHEE